MNIKSTGHFKTKSLILRFYFDIYLLQKGGLLRQNMYREVQGFFFFLSFFFFFFFSWRVPLISVHIHHSVSINLPAHSRTSKSRHEREEMSARISRCASKVSLFSVSTEHHCHWETSLAGARASFVIEGRKRQRNCYDLTKAPEIASRQKK